MFPSNTPQKLDLNFIVITTLSISLDLEKYYKTNTMEKEKGLLVNDDTWFITNVDVKM